MNQRRLLELFWEFEAKLTELHTWYLDSLVGYATLHDHLIAQREKLKSILGEGEFSTDEFQNTLGIAYRDISKFKFTPQSMSPVMKQGELIHRVTKNGHNSILLGRYCIVAAYSYWEKYFRVELGNALNLQRALKIDLWGDIRLIRISIVHGNGIAKTNITECKLLTWFKPGEAINLDYAKMECVFTHMANFRNEIHALSLPSSPTIQL
jgi:hypothetical protein